MNETVIHLKAIAEGWSNGAYTQEQAKQTADRQGLDFEMVRFYKNLYEQFEIECDL
jgi:hypothetical protein